MARAPDIHIGTSGWVYRHWRGTFYPHDLPLKSQLDWYTRHFSTVEINASFYRIPLASAVQQWRTQTPENFVFACKGSRYTTHAKRLLDAPASFSKFFDAVEPLGDKLGPIVFQTPPRFLPDPERLDAFIRALPRSHLYAFEFRDPRWFVPEVRSVLEAHDCAFCIFEIGGLQSPLWRTASLVYVRLHGPGAKYQGSYDDDTLALWKRRLRDWRREGRDVWCYFDNDEAGYAAKDALRLQAAIKGTASPLTRAG